MSDSERTAEEQMLGLSRKIQFSRSCQRGQASSFAADFMVTIAGQCLLLL